MKILPEQMRLYSVTDRTWLHGRKLIDVVSEAIDGGAAFVQLREKSHLEGMELSREELLAEAKKLAQLCHERGVLFVIDDDVELALEAGADGVHVGQEDMAAKKARALLGPDKILGVSAHNPEEARKAQEDGADYLGCGAAFVTGTKLDAKPITAEMMKAVTESMTTLNKYAAQCCKDFEIHACTDVTGFSFLGHLHEMMNGQLSCHIHAGQVPVFEEALRHADEFLLTAAGQRNRNFTGPFVQFEDIPFAMEEILFDPQTSGGLLISLAKEDAPALLGKLKASGLPAEIVGEVLEKAEPEILITN